ncbi:T9SS type A sorting domain-containing protein [Winogradskyella flava]|uniref:T9SS type A sorting domain-containing protein n=1 Tax=Winogradskyella flava TaxID=1884876 RepID=UPI0024900F6C|nr:T9SS type A sorting domain-containing protein [Winogradskyella flava]
MKKLYFLLFTFISFASFGQIINEFQPNAAGADPDPMSIELKGTASSSFSGFLVSIESDGANGLVDRSTAVSGTFDANGLLVVTIPDLENPSFTFVLCSTDPVIGTDLDTNDDGTLDNASPLGTVYDAIGIPDNDADAIITAGYATQLGGVSFAYTGDEPGLVFRDGTSDDWFALNEPYDDSAVFDINATDVFAVNFSPAPALAGTFGSINPVYTMPTNPTITITSPADGAVLAPGTTSVDISYNAINVPGSGSIQVTVNSDAPVTTTDNPVTIVTDNGQPYTVVIDIIDGGMVVDSDMITFSVGSINQVANIAALRAGTEGEFYELTGEALLTYQQSFRNQKFIEDATAGILIDDSAGNVTTTYTIGDGITGIVGELTSFGGMMQFAVSQDPGAATSSGNTLTPQAVSLLDLASNAEDYESELVIVTNVTMDNTTPNFSGGSEHAMDQGGDAFNFRSSFFSADYADQGVAVPTMPTDITGIINERNGNLYFLTARDAADFSLPILSTDNFEATTFSLSPNPTNTGFVTIRSSNNDVMDVQVYDILGKQVKSETLTSSMLNISNLNAGIYLVKITQNNASTTKKLVIK